jgi:hypothetical protein
VRVSGKNTTAWNPSASDGGLSENGTSGQEMEVDAIEEEEINKNPAEEVEMKDKDYAKLKNKVVKSKKGCGKRGT